MESTDIEMNNQPVRPAMNPFPLQTILEAEKVLAEQQQAAAEKVEEARPEPRRRKWCCCARRPICRRIMIAMGASVVAGAAFGGLLWGFTYFQ